MGATEEGLRGRKGRAGEGGRGSSPHPFNSLQVPLQQRVQGEDHIMTQTLELGARDNQTDRERKTVTM